MKRLCKQKAAQQTLTAACQELTDARDRLDRAYSVFNDTADPELLEASIYEINALQSRYNRMLRNIKHISEA